MNFDTKHWIRWGIPGWIYLTVILVYFAIEKLNKTIEFLFTKDVPIIVAAITLFIGTGIMLGHLLHQISMCLGFVLLTKQSRYFRSEYELDTIIIKNSHGSDIQRIYSYRLGNVHALRTLTVSLLLSLLTIIVLPTLNDGYTFEFIYYLLIFILIIVVFINYLYFQNNLNYFIRKIKDDYK